MSDDRLEKIRRGVVNWRDTGVRGLTTMSDVEWLVSEVDRLREENRNLRWVAHLPSKETP